MAILAKKSGRTEDPASDIPALADNPKFAAAFGILRALESGRDTKLADIARLQLEANFAQRAPENARGARDKLLADRLRVLQAKTTAPVPADPADPPPAVAAGLELLRGKVAPSTKAYAEQLAELNRHVEILGEAIRAQSAIIEDIRGDCSLEVAQLLKDRHARNLLDLYRAAQSLAHAADTERALRAAVLRNGYIAREDIIAPPALRAALVLGSEERPDSDLSFLRFQLEQLGILR